jgi:diguanylate cyclase (GGDEF)-like protein
MTTASTFIASMFLAVSMTVSPLAVLLPEDENSTVSAPRRRAASEKLLRVRVLFSKNRVRQRAAGKHLDLPPAAVGRVFERLGGVEDARQFLGRQALKVEQMPPGPDGGNRAEIGQGGGHRHTPSHSDANKIGVILARKPALARTADANRNRERWTGPGWQFAAQARDNRFTLLVPRMTAPAQIVLATADAPRYEAWRAALATVRCQVHRPGELRAGAEIDVIVSDQPLSASGVALDDDRLARGQIGLVAVGVPLPADVSLPADCSPRELRLACLLLSEIIRLRRQREALQRHEKVLSALAMTDPLTGLPNRRAWEQHLAERLTGDGDATPCCLAILDIDLFKGLNDRVGHLAGDDVLKAVAARLSSAVRRRNAVARLGGDEFAVLLEGVEPQLAATVVDRIRSQGSGRVGENGAGERLTLSAGWAAASAPCSRTAIEEAMRRADAALREAKTAGRDQTRPAAD